eukprot:gene13461-biopygen4418
MSLSLSPRSGPHRSNGATFPSTPQRELSLRRRSISRVRGCVRVQGCVLSIAIHRDPRDISEKNPSETFPLNPRETSANLGKPSVRRSVFPQLSATTEERRKTSEDLGRIKRNIWLGTDGDRRNSSENLGRPRKTSENLGKPRETSEDLGKVSGKCRWNPEAAAGVPGIP